MPTEQSRPIPVSMLALQARAFKPEAELTILDLPVPQAGEGEVLIEIASAGLSYVDALMAQGSYQKVPPLPFTLGMECAGRVIQVGAGVDQLAVGDRVVAFWVHGAFAEYIAVPAERAYRIPDAMDLEQAAVFGLAHVTAHLGLVRRAGLRPGDTVLITGASGSVGRAAAFLAKSLGATVLAATREAGAARQQPCPAADHVVSANPTTLRDEVMAVTGGRGVNVVFDVVGGAILTQALRTLSWEGRGVIVGFASGGQEALKPGHLLVKNVGVMAVQVSDYCDRLPLLVRDIVEDLMQRFIGGALEVPAPRALDLYGVREELLGLRTHAGRERPVLRWLPAAGSRSPIAAVAAAKDKA